MRRPGSSGKWSMVWLNAWMLCWVNVCLMKWWLCCGRCAPTPQQRPTAQRTGLRVWHCHHLSWHDTWTNDLTLCMSFSVFSQYSKDQLTPVSIDSSQTQVSLNWMTIGCEDMTFHIWITRETDIDYGIQRIGIQSLLRPPKSTIIQIRPLEGRGLRLPVVDTRPNQWAVEVSLGGGLEQILRRPLPQWHQCCVWVEWKQRTNQFSRLYWRPSVPA